MSSGRGGNNDRCGFLPQRSCALQLLITLEEWLRVIDQHEAVDIIYLDFQKAFDSVPHQRLLAKLRAYGVDGALLRWITAFLGDRKQRVVVEGEHSGWTEVCSGIPQGSVLGPILFLIFINDLPNAVKSSTKLFADDTKLYRGVSDSHDRSLLQGDIDALEEWAEKWQLPFNQDKCKLMHLGSTNRGFDYQMAGTNIVQVQQEKDLGVVIDNRLKFHEQTAAAVGRANRILGLIRRAFLTLDCRALPILYKTLVRPHLEYANSVWGPTSKRDQDALERVQRRATKQVQALSHLPYQARLRALRLPSLHYRRIRGDMITLYQILTGNWRVSADDFFQRESSDRTRGHHLKLKKSQVNGRLRQSSFCYRVVDNWNRLTTEVVSSPNVNIFKNRLDKLWKEKMYKLRQDD